LDHLFGIQNRAGCACAGPYGHRLLGIDLERSERFRAQIRRGKIGIKPGWVRLSLPWYASEEDVEFILSAIEFVADRGADFVPAYELGWRDGVWRHIARPVPDIAPIELTVDALEAASTRAGHAPHVPLGESSLAAERARYFVEATRAADELATRCKHHVGVENPPSGDRAIDALIWFSYLHASGM
jgi:hypothetical protein